jgi:flagellar biosynthesis/type III secretory pathway protein FliH
MLAIWCWVVEKILSDPRRLVHAPNTTDFKAWSFLNSTVADNGFQKQGISPSLPSGFHRARLEAMPNNTFRSSPVKHVPPAPSDVVPMGTTPLLPHAAAPGDVDAQALEEVRAQAFAEGMAQGREQGLQDARHNQAAEQAAHAQAHEHQATQLLQTIAHGMAELRQDPDALFEPLKKLALHLAEELVLGELNVGPQAIDRLVQRCVDTLDTSASTPLVIQLNPSDLAVLRSHPETESDRPDHWTWEVDNHLSPGSVRIKANDTVVSDFVEHRLTALAQSLLKPETPWASQSAFNPDRFAQRQSASAVEDVQPRSTSPGRSEPWTEMPEASDPDSATETLVSKAVADAADDVEVLDPIEDPALGPVMESPFGHASHVIDQDSEHA